MISFLMFGKTRNIFSLTDYFANVIYQCEQTMVQFLKKEKGIPTTFGPIIFSHENQYRVISNLINVCSFYRHFIFRFNDGILIKKSVC
jgi:hypothetical protein